MTRCRAGLGASRLRNAAGSTAHCTRFAPCPGVMRRKPRKTVDLGYGLSGWAPTGLPAVHGRSASRFAALTAAS